MSVDRRVKAWLLTLPGTFQAETVEEVYRKAWAASGITCGVTDLREAPNRAGHVHQQRGDSWVLALPSTGIPRYV